MRKYFSKILLPTTIAITALGLLSSLAHATTPPLPLDNVLYTIKSENKDANSGMLSTDGKRRPDGKSMLVDLYGKDDNSGRQKWLFKKVGSQYNIVQKRTSMFLSNNGVRLVDLWWIDDNSGRQRWVLAPQRDGTFTIKWAHQYLSTDGKNLVDLYGIDDNSGRQRWTLVPEDIEYVRVDFNESARNIAGVPDLIQTTDGENKTSSEQELTFKFEVKAIETSSFNSSHGFTFSVSGETEVGIPLVGKTKVTMSASTTNTWEYGKSKSNEITRSVEIPVKVPSCTKVIGTAIVKSQKTTIPYTAVGKSKLTGEEIKLSGRWAGVQAGDIRVTWDQRKIPNCNFASNG
jgi:hypothetical protein